MSSSQFDRIAPGYDDSLPPHVVEHYLRKRVGSCWITARGERRWTSAAGRVR